MTKSDCRSTLLKCVSSACSAALLHRRIERRVNVESAEIDLLGREQDIQITLHRVHRVVLLNLRQPFRIGGDPRGFRLLRFSGGDLFQLEHSIENGVSLDGCAFRIFQRRKTIWTPDQTGKERRFRQIQFATRSCRSKPAKRFRFRSNRSRNKSDSHRARGFVPW